MLNVHCSLVFRNEVLGTASSDPQIHERFIASKAPDAPSLREEVEAIGVDGVEERAMTVFPRLADGTPFLWDYQIKGFFKDACGMLRRATGSKSAKLRAYKKEIDGCLFVRQRKVRLRMPEGSTVGSKQRPLRAQTAQGDRVALANSEMLDAGTTCEFDVALLNHDLLPYLVEWMSYGQLRGIGQWRNASYGAFECTLTDDKGKVIFDNIGD